MDVPIHFPRSVARVAAYLLYVLLANRIIQATDNLDLHWMITLRFGLSIPLQLMLLIHHRLIEDEIVVDMHRVD